MPSVACFLQNEENSYMKTPDSASQQRSIYQSLHKLMQKVPIRKIIFKMQAKHNVKRIVETLAHHPYWITLGLWMG